MSSFEKLGAESRVLLYLPPGAASGTVEAEDGGHAGKVRAEFRLGDSFPDGDWLDVEIVAQVFDGEYVERYKRTPQHPVAEGTAVRLKARRSKSIVDLPLPPMPFGDHPVVAKVYSLDERYRKLFDPAEFYLGVVTYGYLARIRRTELEDVYAGVGNPAAEQEIRRQVRGGAIIVEGDDGLYEAAEDNGRLVLRPYQQFEVTLGAAAEPPIASGVVAIEGALPAVAEVFAKNGQLMAGQLAPILLNAAAKSREVAQRIQALGATPRFRYRLGAAKVTGSRVEFPVNIHAR